MKRNVETTSDGSTTLRVEGWGEPYHSMHGAIQESMHVFIANGLQRCTQKKIRVLEMGFGTGLNALLSMQESVSSGMVLHYTALEAYPLTLAEAQQMNYPGQLGTSRYSEDYLLMHKGPWGEEIRLSPSFTLHKIRADFNDYSANGQFDLIYFDAFGPRVQPELWTEEMFERMYKALDNNGALVTYCAKGSVRRAMQHNGFYVERLKGPPGKREMLRAVK